MDSDCTVLTYPDERIQRYTARYGHLPQTGDIVKS